MTTVNYPLEELGPNEDDGTMPDNVATLAEAVIGHRIVKAEKGALDRPSSWGATSGLVLTLDTGARVKVVDTDDCCAYTELESFLLHPQMVDHVITGVGTTEGYTKWHVFADAGDVLELTVGWSAGNPFYYGYGFEIAVEEVA